MLQVRVVQPSLSHSLKGETEGGWDFIFGTSEDRFIKDSRRASFIDILSITVIIFIGVIQLFWCLDSSWLEWRWAIFSITVVDKASDAHVFTSATAAAALAVALTVANRFDRSFEFFLPNLWEMFPRIDRWVNMIDVALADGTAAVIEWAIRLTSDGRLHCLAPLHVYCDRCSATNIWHIEIYDWAFADGTDNGTA